MAKNKISGKYQLLTRLYPHQKRERELQFGAERVIMEMTPSTKLTLQLWFQTRGSCFHTCKAHACSPGREGSSECVDSANSNRPSFLIQPYSTV